jgi:hypothetical protein
MPGYAPSDWKKTFELYTGIRFDDDDVFSKLSDMDMPAGKLAELIMDLCFGLDDLPALEIMNDEDYMPEDDYEQSPVGAFAGGSLDRLRDIYRETFKDLAREAVGEAETE